MPRRTPLVLALLGAGFLSGEGLPEALSGGGLVPELALLDGAVCGRPAILARGPLLVARAKQTEVSPAGAAAAARSV